MFVHMSVRMPGHMSVRMSAHMSRQMPANMSGIHTCAHAHRLDNAALDLVRRTRGIIHRNAFLVVGVAPEVGLCATVRRH